MHVRVGAEDGERRVQLSEPSVVQGDYFATVLNDRARTPPVVDGVAHLRGARGLVKVEVVVGRLDVRVVRRGHAPNLPWGQRRPRPDGEEAHVAQHAKAPIAEPPFRIRHRRRAALGGHRAHRGERAVHVNSRLAVVVSQDQVDKVRLGPRRVRHQVDRATRGAGVDGQIEHRPRIGVDVHRPLSVVHRPQRQKRVVR